MPNNKPVNLNLLGRKNKKSMTREHVNNSLESRGYTEEEIKEIEKQAYSSQYVYGNFKADNYIDLNKNLEVISSSNRIPIEKSSKALPDLDKKVEKLIPLISDIRNHLRGKQTGMQLIENAKAVNLAFSRNHVKLSTTVESIIDNYDLFKKATQYVVYDTETFGGVNKHGFQELLALQEIAINKVVKNAGPNGYDVASSRSTVLGLYDPRVNGIVPEGAPTWDINRIDRITAMIEDYEKTGTLGSESISQVTLRRLNMLGSPETKIVKDKGLATIESFHGDSDLSAIKMREGLRRMKDIGEYQNSYSDGSPIPPYIREFFGMVQDINENVSVGKNILQFDDVVENVYIQELGRRLTREQRDYVLETFGDIRRINHSKGVVEQEAILRAAVAINGTSSLYTREQQEMLHAEKLTPGQLESIGRVYFPERYAGGDAHAAGVDITVSADYASKPILPGKNGEMISLLDSQVEVIKQQSSKVRTKFNFDKDGNISLPDDTGYGRKAKPVFIATKSDYSDKNLFDFTINLASGDVHFANQKVLGSNGEITNSIFKPSNKKNALYTFNVLETRNTSKKILEAVKDIDSYKGAKNLFILEMMPELEERYMNGNYSMSNANYAIFRTQEEMEAYISNNYMPSHLKELKPNGEYHKAIPFKESDGFSKEFVDEIEDALSIVTIGENGAKSTRRSTVKERVAKSHEHLRGDSASRSVRDYSYVKAKRFLDVDNELIKASNALENRKTPRELLSLITGHKVSKIISQNEKLSAFDKELISNITGILANGRENKLQPGVLNNFYNTYDYNKRMQRTIRTVFDLSTDENIKNSQMYYDTYMRNLRTDISESITSNEETEKQFFEYLKSKGVKGTKEDLLKGNKELKIYNYDSNYFEFKMPNNFFDSLVNTEKADDAFKINLKPGSHYSLTRELITNQYGSGKYKKMDSVKRNRNGIIQLTRFINEVNNQEDNKGIFNELINEVTGSGYREMSDADVKISANDLAERVVNTLSQKRKESPTSGFVTPRSYMDTLDDDLLIGFAELEQNQGMINDSLKKTRKVLNNKFTSNVNYNNPDAIKAKAAQIVDEALFRVTDEAGNKITDINKIALFAEETYGYNRNVVHAQMSKTYSDSVEIVSKLLKPVLGYGGDVILNGNKVKLRMEGQNTIDITDLLPVTTFANGKITNSVGLTNTIGGMYLDVENGMINGTFNPRKAKIRSLIGQGSKELNALNYNLEKAINEGQSTTDTVLYTLKRMAKQIRKNPQAGSGSTQGEALNSIYNIDMDEMKKAIPFLYDDIMSSSSFSETEKKVITNNIRSLRDGKSDAEFTQIFSSILPGLNKLVLGVDSREFESTFTDEMLLNELNVRTRETSHEKNLFHTGDKENVAYSQLSNDNRPPTYQKLNARVYNTSDIKNRIDSKGGNAGKYFRPFSNIVSASEKKRAERNFVGVGKTNSSFTGLRVNIDDETYHKTLYNLREELGRQNLLTDELRQLFDFGSSLNLFEQEKIINSRIAEQIYDGVDTQFINAKKNVINTILQKEEDVNTTKELFQRQTKAIPIVTIDPKTGKVNFKYSGSQYIKESDAILQEIGYGGKLVNTTARHDGLLGFGYYSEGSILKIDENTISKELTQQGFRNEQDIFEYLSNKYNPKFFVETDAYKGVMKSYVDSEKGMATYSAIGAGRINKNISRVLDESGYGSKHGKLIKDNFIDVVLANVEGIDNILNKSGFNSIADFKNAVHAERHSFTDKILSQIPGFKDAFIFTNDARVKHKSMDMFFKEMFGTATYIEANKLLNGNSYSNFDDAYRAGAKNVYEKIQSSPLSRWFSGIDESTGQFISKYVEAKDAIISKDEVLRTAEILGINTPDGIGLFETDGRGNKYSLSYGNFTVAGPTEFVGKSQSNSELKSLSREMKEMKTALIEEGINPEDSDAYKTLQERRTDLLARHKMLTVDKRGMGVLQKPSYRNEGKMQEIKDRLGGIDGGDEIFRNLYGDITSIDENGRVSLNSNVPKYQNHALISQLERDAMYNPELEYLGGKYSRLDDSYVKGVSRDSEKFNIMKRVQDSDIDNISVGKAELMYAEQQGSLAMKWNSGKMTPQAISELEGKGFSHMNLDDVFIPEGASSADVIKTPGNYMEKSLLLDVGEGNTLAIPYKPATIAGGAIVNTERDKAIASLVNVNSEINSAISGKIDGADITSLKGKKERAITKLKEVLKDDQIEINNAIGTASMDSYTFNKGTGMQYFKGLGKGNNPFYDQAEFMGKTLGELAENGTYIGAATLGESYFRDLGYFDEDFLKQANMTESSMREYLSTKGTIGLIGRNPNTEIASLSPAMIYLDTQFNDGRIRTTAELVLALNADHDGDNLTVTALKHNGMDFGKSKILGQNDEVLNEHLKSIMGYTTMNKKIHDGMVEKKIAKDANEALADITSMFKDSDYFIANSETSYSLEETQKLLNINKLITQDTMGRLGEDNFNALNQSKTIDALRETATNLYEGADLDRANEAINYSLQNVKKIQANMAKGTRMDIGFMDTPAVELDTMAANLLSDNPDDIHSIHAIVKTLRETPISSKHGDTLELSATAPFRNAWSGAMNGSATDAQKVIDIVSDYRSGILEEVRTKTDILSLSDNDDEAFAQVIRPLEDIMERVRTDKEAKALYKSMKKVNSSNILDHDVVGTSSPFGKVYSQMTNAIEITPEVLDNSELSTKAFRRSAMNMRGEIAESLSHGFSASNFGLAKGALGLAAAIMVTGYIGGNPTVNPAEDDMNEYESLQDDDLSIQSMPEGAGQGYVININAQSDKGQQHVQEAIQKAMQSSMPTDVNIQMNISDRTSNINSRFIDKLLTGAL